MTLRSLIKWEYGINFLLLLAIYIYLDFSVLWFFLCLLVPDICALGYVMNERIGAILYNVGHSFILPSTLLTIALLTSFSFLLPIALIWLAHIFMDRALGYGLKYTTGFKDTHIQRIL
ncbi:DUF4260 domain-containing protein [Metasolibacillus sp. FSL H7-0170]|uniref:DUF4260 domain-containing protein n=1 Tax=Metasolibacillus TaxID=2703677 RepID=UPI00079C2904|nr:DUF4260 domain-containing protein [Metasolibacillus fluoroglycofenilyticus]KYG88904.1 hypothetical protein A0U40_14485 [[Bacillus] sp. KCTC 13219]